MISRYQITTIQQQALNAATSQAESSGSDQPIIDFVDQFSAAPTAPNAVLYQD